MTSKIPHVLVFTGLGITLLGGVLWFYQLQREKEEALQAQAQQTAAPAQPQAQKIPLTVFADEGVPREATRP